MKDITEFIEKALKGGFTDAEYLLKYLEGRTPKERELMESTILLNPLAWQAVGKMSNWGTEMTMIDEPGHPKEWLFFEHCAVCGETINDQEDGCPDGCKSDDAYVPEWLYNMHRLIDALAEGKTIEEYLHTL